MKRLFVVLALASAACSRSTPPAARPPARPVSVRTATPAPQPARAMPRLEEEREEVMDPIRDLSPYPNTAAGAQTLFTDLAQAALRHDARRIGEVTAHLDPDRLHFDLAFTFDGARRLRDPVLFEGRARRAALQERLATLREPVQVQVRSALGSELAAGAPGMDPHSAALGPLVRPAVRFYRVEVRGADGTAVVFEPVAYLGGRWSYLAEAWRALQAAPPQGPGSLTH